MGKFGYIGVENLNSGVKSLKETQLAEVDIYLSAGGNSGGCCDWGGGGGGGGVLDTTIDGKPLVLQKGVSYTVTIGGNGGNSKFATLQANAGGSGRPAGSDGNPGGCGGGGGANTYTTGGASNQGDPSTSTFSGGILTLKDLTETTTAQGQGFAGGSGNWGGNHANGGGGANGAGSDGAGSGRPSSFDGSATYYSGGGGAAGRFYGPSGGNSGGGNGGSYGGNGGSAGANRGSGGGGQGYGGSNSGSGGSGICYIKTKSNYTKTGTSTSGTYGGYNWVRWTGSGTITFT